MLDLAGASGGKNEVVEMTEMKLNPKPGKDRSCAEIGSLEHQNQKYLTMSVAGDLVLWVTVSR